MRAALIPPWRELDVVEVTGSTNADLAARARAGASPGAVLVAEHQHAGRGRLDRSWSAPPRSSLAVSVLVDLAEVPAARACWLPLLTGLAVIEVVRGVCGVPAQLKWPNDVLVPVPADGRAGGQNAELEQRKVGGILAEMIPTSGAAVVGVGINVTQTQDELPVATATSLLLAGSATTDRDTILRAYLRALDTRFRAWSAALGDPRRSGIGAAYREACSTLGLEVCVQRPSEPPVTGTAQEVDDDGRLVVLAPDGTLHALAAGDVVHVRKT